MTLVSVVVPAFNAARTLSETLDSVRAQDWSDLEIVVVDDGSTDATAAIARQHAAGDPRIRVISQPNGGASRARNHGIETTRAAYVAPCDADDIWHPEKISRLMHRMQELGPETGYVYSLSRKIDANSRITGQAGFPGYEGAVYLRSLVLNFVGNGSAILARRAALEGVAGYATALGNWEDWHLQTVIARHWKVGCVPHFLTGYRVAGQGKSANELHMLTIAQEATRLVFEACPETPRQVRDAAMAARSARLAVKKLRLRMFGGAARDLARAISLSPRIALEVAWLTLSARIAAAGQTGRGLRGWPEPGPQFFAVGPETPVGTPDRPVLHRLVGEFGRTRGRVLFG